MALQTQAFKWNQEQACQETFGHSLDLEEWKIPIAVCSITWPYCNWFCSHTYNLLAPDQKPSGAKDLPVGKVRIRLSTLESDRVYTNAYPLLVVTPQGVKKMGEVELAVRLSCASTLNLMSAYLQPQLPRMHYFYPLDAKQLESLRVAAMNIVALRLMRSEPPLRQEVVQFMLDTEAERWSMRRSKANYFRIMVWFCGLVS